MSQHQEDIIDNKHFQLERMILFSDAVFAIVITLLVIEIKIPEHTEEGLMQAGQLSKGLWELMPHFIGFIATFLVTGMFWQIHHRVFGYVTSYDSGLIWLNLLLLLTVCCLPFTASLVSEYGYLDLAYSIYSINLGLISLLSAFIWTRISNPKRNLATQLQKDINMIRYGKVRSFVISAIFFSGAVLCMFHYSPLSWAGRFIFFLIFPAISILRRRYKIKKAHHASKA